MNDTYQNSINIIDNISYNELYSYNTNHLNNSSHKDKILNIFNTIKQSIKPIIDNDTYKLLKGDLLLYYIFYSINYSVVLDDRIDINKLSKKEIIYLVINSIDYNCLKNFNIWFNKLEPYEKSYLVYNSSLIDYKNLRIYIYLLFNGYILENNNLKKLFYSKYMFGDENFIYIYNIEFQLNSSLSSKLNDDLFIYFYKLYYCKTNKNLILEMYNFINNCKLNKWTKNNFIDNICNLIKILLEKKIINTDFIKNNIKQLDMLTLLYYQNNIEDISIIVTDYYKKNIKNICILNDRYRDIDYNLVNKIIYTDDSIITNNIIWINNNFKFIKPSIQTVLIKKIRKMGKLDNFIQICPDNVLVNKNLIDYCQKNVNIRIYFTENIIENLLKNMTFNYCDKLIFDNEDTKYMVIKSINNIINSVLNSKSRCSKTLPYRRILKYLKNIDQRKYEEYLINCFNNYKNKLYLFNIKDVYYVLKKYEIINFNNDYRLLKKYIKKYKIIRMMTCMTFNEVLNTLKHKVINYNSNLGYIKKYIQNILIYKFKMDEDEIFNIL